MTVTYSLETSTSTLCGYQRLLFRWRGSVWRLVWSELLIWVLIYGGISVIYRNILDEWNKSRFEDVVLFCDHYTSSLPVTFILGFYVSVILRRWWDIFQNIAWPDKTAYIISACCRGNDDVNRIFRRTLVRYLMLAEVMVFRSISSAVKKRFPTMDHVKEAECILFRTDYYRRWCCTLIKKAGPDIDIDDFTRHKLIEPILEFKSNLGALMSYDWISLPLVYTQVVTVAVRSFFAMSLIGRQYLNPAKHSTHTKVDLYVPLFTILEFIFFVGWLKVAEALINPWGEDDDDFEVNYIIDRNFQVGYLIVDDNFDVAPPLEQDLHWDSPDPSLPHTQASVCLRHRKKQNPMMGSAFNIRVPKSASRIVKVDATHSATEHEETFVKAKDILPKRSQSQPEKKNYELDNLKSKDTVAYKNRSVPNNERGPVILTEVDAMAVRCLNCQEMLELDASLTEKYPEWPALTASFRNKTTTTVRSNAAGVHADNATFNVGSGNNSTAGDSAAVDLGGGSDTCELNRFGDGDSLAQFSSATQGNLFDFICNDSTPLEHPLCQECCDRLLDCMDRQLKQLEEECADYRRLNQGFFDKNAQQPSSSTSVPPLLDADEHKIQLGRIQSEERVLRSELAHLEAEERSLEETLDNELQLNAQTATEEERLWTIYRDHIRKLLDLEQEEVSISNQLKYTNDQLDRLSKTNVFNLAFHVWHSGRFGTVNGFRLGRLPDEKVDWNEINAAWGQTALLVKSLARKLDLTFERYEPVPFGSFSYIRCLDDTVGGKEKQLPLYCSGGYKPFGHGEFDSAMVAMLDCARQLQDKIKESGEFAFPYPMQKDRIVDSGKEYSVKYQFNSDERWTKAMKCLLMNLKWALAYAAQR